MREHTDLCREAERDGRGHAPEAPRAHERNHGGGGDRAAGDGSLDRLNRRLVTSATLVIQIAGLTLLAWAPSAVGVYTVCALFGLGVGNLTTLPGLILAVEWPREQFSALVSLVVGINQFTFAFGPSLVSVMRDRAGTYGPALGACTALQLVVAAMILLGPGHAPR
jgi:predicted MFS family arabinose efflux permease